MSLSLSLALYSFYQPVGNISLVPFRWCHFVGAISLVPFRWCHFDGNTYSLLLQEILKQVRLSDSSLLRNDAGQMEGEDFEFVRKFVTYQPTRRHTQGDLNIHRYDYQSLKSHNFPSVLEPRRIPNQY